MGANARENDGTRRRPWWRLLNTRKWRTTVAVNLASTIERADEQLLPAMYTYLGTSLHCSVKELGFLTSCRALAQALASPFAGILGFYCNRTLVMAGGCFLWGLMTTGFSTVRSLRQGVLLWIVNGIGLALVVPTIQSLTADYFSEKSRGAAFGALFFTGALGAMASQLYGTNSGGVEIMGIEGWRFVIITVGLISVLFGLMTMCMVHDPRNDPVEPSGEGEVEKVYPSFQIRSLLRNMWTVLKMPTFVLIVVQGVFGSFPWQAISYLTHYLQLLGMSNFGASVLMSTFQVSTAFGAILGGVLGDYMGTRFPNHGRIFTCQFSVGVKLPLVYILLRCLPKDGEASTFWMHAIILGMIGVLGPWAAAACNNPIFAEIVPATHRNMVYGFDRSFEGSVAALGAPLVGLVAEWFGYTGRVEVTGDPAYDLPHAQALGDSLFFWLFLPWAICLLLYTFIHWTYPRDRDNTYMYLPTEVRFSNRHLKEGDKLG